MSTISGPCLYLLIPWRSILASPCPVTTWADSVRQVSSENHLELSVKEQSQTPPSTQHNVTSVQRTAHASGPLARCLRFSVADTASPDVPNSGSFNSLTSLGYLYIGKKLVHPVS